MKTDLTIVGAGFAGLACARAAAARGLETVVLEAKQDPGRNCHTTGLLVKEVAEEFDFPRGATREIRGVRLYSPSLRFIDLVSPGYYFLATDTPAVLRWLAGRAEAAGARLHCGVAFRGASRNRVGLALDGTGIETRYLIGADGARSRTARAFGLGRNRRFLLGAELELEGVRGVDPGFLHCFLDSRLAPGYLAWVVPGVSCTQAGLACLPSQRPDPGALLRRLEGLFDFSSARVVGQRAGAIPVGGPVKPFACPDVMLIGDAAGLVSPLTAGGIHTAMLYGRLAASAVADHLLRGAAQPARVLSRSMPRFFWKRWLRRALDLRPPNLLLDALSQPAAFRALAATVFFHHRGLWTRAAWRDLAWALLRPPGRRDPAAS